MTRPPQTLLAFFLLLALASHEGQCSQGKVLMCYATNWSLYRARDIKFRAEDIDPHLCTHVVHAFFGINQTSGAVTSIDSWADFRTSNGGLDFVPKIQRLKRKNPNLKVMISVGGWEEGSVKFSETADSTRKTNTFVETAFDLIEKYAYDGLDISWQYPTDRGGIPQDKQNLVKLLKELRKKFRPSGLLLTIRVIGKRYVIDPGYDLKNIAKEVDYISLMGHEYNGWWDQVAEPHAPLYANSEFCVDFSVTYLLEKGVPKEKLILGVGLYAVNYVLKEEPTEEPEMGLPISQNTYQSPLSKMNGFTSYFEICNDIKSKSGWKEYWDDPSKTPFMVKGTKMITYENELSIDEKMQYVNEKGLAGASAYSIDMDDFKGACGKGKYPLVESMKKGLKDGVKGLIDIRVISHEYGK